jgi:predicted HAD superfamily Cof-like phosphohydrolase
VNHEQVDIRLMMDGKQCDKLDESLAWENTNRPLGFPLGATAFQFTGHFHQVMGLPAPDYPITPPVSMRERRLRLILEEFLELVEANGFRLIPGIVVGDSCTLQLEHIEGSRYDVVETADALADLNVVVAGTAVEYGIPMHVIDYEVYCSNLSKLENGQPIVNHCQRCGPNEDNVYYSTCACDSAEFWLKPDAPIGKILKPDSFVPANIPLALFKYQERKI